MIKKILVLLVVGSILTSGCTGNNLKPAPKPVNDAQEIQNDPNLTPAMKARLLHQVQGQGNTQPGTRAAMSK
jgi:hypothetical protein